MGMRSRRWTAEKNNVARKHGFTYGTLNSKLGKLVTRRPIGAGMQRAKAREDAARVARDVRLAEEKGVNLP